MPPDPAVEPAAEHSRGEQHPETVGAPSSWQVAIAPTLIALLAVALLFAQTRHYELLGHDCYPIIITSRVHSFADLLGNFTEKLMDGRYFADFYRPLLNFSFALDYAVWELNPVGYQLTNALLFGGCALALFGLVRRLAGGGAWLAPLVAMVFFILHPTQFELVPVPPRRADLLCCLFMALALSTQLSPKALKMKRPPIWPAIWGLLAIASKETAFILPALAYVAVLLYSPRNNRPNRALHAWGAIIPQIAAATLMVAARVGVIGGWGGHEAAEAGSGLARLPSTIGAIVTGLVHPQAVMQETSLAGWLASGALLGVTVTGILARASAHSLTPVTAPARRPLGAGIVSLTWVLLVSATYVMTAHIEPWYLFLPVGGLVICVGTCVDALLTTVRRARWPARLAATATLVPLLALASWQARYSPFFEDYDLYRRASAVSDDFFGQLRVRIAATPDGSAVLAPPMMKGYRPWSDRPTVSGATVLTDYAVQAWAELTYPERRIRVASGHPATIRAPAPDELVIVIY